MRFYFQAAHPTIDIADMKTLFFEQQLKTQEHVHLTPEKVLSKLPKVEPFALGSVLMEYAPGDEKWQGHWHPAPHLVWESLPRWSWDDFYNQFDLDPNYRKSMSKKESESDERLHIIITSEESTRLAFDTAFLASVISPRTAAMADASQKRYARRDSGRRFREGCLSRGKKNQKADFADSLAVDLRNLQERR